MVRNKISRESNIELLRIVSMFLVLMIHYIPIRGIPTKFSLENDFWETVFNLELRSICFVCVNCFILISGYFGIRWKVKSILNYIYQVLFWVVLCYFIAILIGVHDFNGLEFLKRLSSFLSYNWFILSYLGLYMFAPVLNSFIEKCSQRELGRFIIIFYLFSTYFGYILQVSPEFKEGTTFVSLMGLYLIGAFIRRYEYSCWFIKFNKYIDLLIYLGIGVFLVLVSIIAISLGFDHSLYGYLNPFIIAESLFLFLFFRKLNIPQSKIINYMAGSAFAVYLFHYNPSIIGIYTQICRYIQDNFRISLFYILLFLGGVFIIAVIIDKVRIWSFNRIWNVLNIQ